MAPLAPSGARYDYPRGLVFPPKPKKKVAAMPKAGKPWTPFTAATKPPPNTYDPNLDAQQRAGNRGLADLLADIGLKGERSSSDYITAQGDLNRRRTEGLADYGRQRDSVNLGYQQLGNRQAQSTNAAGLVGGGALAQATEKRGVNNARDLAPITLNEQRLNEGTDRALGQLSQNFQRSGVDDATQLSRAQRENTFFGQDLGASRFYQATGTGYVAPKKPGNENTVGKTTYRRVNIGGKTYFQLPNGKYLTQRPKG